MERRFVHDVFLLCMSAIAISLCISAHVKDNFLLVNDPRQNKIFQFNLETSKVEALSLQPNLSPVDVTYDPSEEMVYWSDNEGKAIKAAEIDGAYETTVISLNNASVCDGLAADYINRLLFFTDTGNDVIGVVSMSNYELFTYIITDSLDEPRDIVVSPNQGIIYWSDWGAKPRIETSNMDGSKRQTLVTLITGAWPNGLALDAQENQLFWVDAFAEKISVIDLASRKIRTLFQEQNAHYFGVDVIGKYLYLTDWEKYYLRRVSKEGGQLTQYGPATFLKLYGIKGYNSSEAFTGLSVCVSSLCEHLCLPIMNNQYSCRCTEGYISQGSQCKKHSSEAPEDDVMTPSITSIISTFLSDLKNYDNRKHIKTENESRCTYGASSK